MKIRVPYKVENFSFWTTSSFSRRIRLPGVSQYCNEC